MEKLREEIRHAHSLVIACVVIATLALVVAFSGSITAVVVSKRDAQHARQLASQAKRAAAFNRRVIQEQAKNTFERRKVAHEISVRECTNRHQDHVALTSLLASTLIDGRRLLRQGVYDKFGAAVKAAAVRGLRRTEQLYSQLVLSDCDPLDPHDVLPDPSVPSSADR